MNGQACPSIFKSPGPIRQVKYLIRFNIDGIGAWHGERRQWQRLPINGNQKGNRDVPELDPSSLCGA
jgi:hypothetical protein